MLTWLARQVCILNHIPSQNDTVALEDVVGNIPNSRHRLINSQRNSLPERWACCGDTPSGSGGSSACRMPSFALNAARVMVFFFSSRAAQSRVSPNWASGIADSRAQRSASTSRRSSASSKL